MSFDGLGLSQSLVNAVLERAMKRQLFRLKLSTIARRDVMAAAQTNGKTLVLLCPKTGIVGH